MVPLLLRKGERKLNTGTMEETFLFIIEVIGTFAFAISGIRLAAFKSFDWFGAYTVGLEASWTDRLRHLVLPLTAVAAGHLWYCVWLVRGRLLEEVRADYVLLARAKGLSRRRILVRHCLRNVLPSYLNMMAVFVPHILGGTYVVETVFSYPGIGTLCYESVRYRDYNLLMLLCILTGGVVMLCSLLARALSEALDPRLRREEDGYV